LANVLAGAQPAQAILNYYIYENGGNVVVQSSGSLDLTGASSSGFAWCTVSGALVSNIAGICTGPNIFGSPYALTGPIIFAGNAALQGADSVSGFSSSIVGASSQLIVESTYTGGPISGNATFNGQTLLGLGFTTPGLIGTWTIIGTSETINVLVGAPPAPSAVPGPLPLLGAGAAFGYSRRLRRRVSLSRTSAQPATSISS